MKILHTADIHLDWKFLGIHDPSNRHRRHQEHREVFRGIVEVGLEEQIDVMFIVGDLFEQSRFSLDTIRFIQRGGYKIFSVKQVQDVKINRDASRN